MLKSAENIFTVLKGAGKLLSANDPLRMAGATAFFSMFALPPMLIIIVRTLGLFFDKRTMGRNIMDKVGNVLGNDGRDQIRTVIRSVRGFQLQPWAAVLMFIFLLFVATTLFAVVKDSINQIWRIRVDKKRQLKSVLLSRAKAAGFILFTGGLFLIVMAVEFLQAYFGQYVTSVPQQLCNYGNGILNHAISLAAVTAWFFTLFRFLPDGRPPAAICFTGSLVAGVLFSIGKYILRWALSGNVNEIYGTSGSLVLILLFVFYTSLILYYSAAFTRMWAEYRDEAITPLSHASVYHIAPKDTDAQQDALAVNGI